MEQAQVQHAKTLEQSKILILENSLRVAKVALRLGIKIITQLNSVNKRSEYTLASREFIRVASQLLESK